MVKYLTAEEFKEKVYNYEHNKDWKFEGDKPCVIDFYADWCAPCKALAPILEELDQKYGDKVDIYKVNTEKEQELSSIFGIRSIPSLLFVPQKGEPQMSQGALSLDAFDQAFEDVLGLKA